MTQTVEIRWAKTNINFQLIYVQCAKSLGQISSHKRILLCRGSYFLLSKINHRYSPPADVYSLSVNAYGINAYGINVRAYVFCSCGYFENKWDRTEKAFFQPVIIICRKLAISTTRSSNLF